MRNPEERFTAISISRMEIANMLGWKIDDPRLTSRLCCDFADMYATVIDSCVDDHDEEWFATEMAEGIEDFKSIPRI